MLISLNSRKSTYKNKTVGVLGQNLERIQNESLDEFLLERYVAYVRGSKTRRYFRIWHDPWLKARIAAIQVKDDLMIRIGLWGKTMELVLAHYSPGVSNVWMGRPQKVK